MDDQYIINFISKYNGKFKFNSLPENIKEYLLNRYKDCDNLNESYFRIKNKLDEHPKCIICGKDITFNGRNYYQTCCHECSKILNKQNREKTCLKKYNVKNPYQISEVINHIKQINKEKREETNIKLKETNNIKYGGNSPMCSKDIKEKAKHTLFNNYGVKNSYLIPIVKENCKNENINNKEIHNQKRKQTCLEKYGVDNVFKNNNIQQKCKQTCLEKYGVEYFYQSNNFKQKSKQTCLEKYGVEYITQTTEYIENFKNNWETIKEKIYKTKKENNTFNKSNPEEICYKLLCEKFNIIKRQYQSQEYPFLCDFYIEDINTYIEYQGFWTHGKKPYDGTEEDIKMLNNWKEKNTLFYKRAIINRTINDVKKRNIAKENNLNYLEFFNIEDFKQWINNYKNK